MPNENLDAKEGVDSSPTSDATASQDAKQETADTSTAAKPATAQTEEQTLESVVSKAAQESLAREDAAESAASKESSTEKEKEPVVGEKAAEDKVVDTTKDEDVPKEFHEHPAWKRVIGERNAVREENAKLQAAVKAETSLVNYCKQRGVTDDQFRQAMEVVSLLNTDPAKAYENLRPLMEGLETHMGMRLPQDLDAKVKEGILDPETAKEVARLRAEKTFAAQRGQTEATQRQQAVVASMVTGLNAWDQNKRATDPDFDKKVDLVRGVYLTMYQATDAQGRPLNPVRTPDEAVALAEKAYAEVNSKIAGFVPARAQQRVLTSRNASTERTTKKPGSTKEAVAAMLKEKYGTELSDNGD